MVVIVTVLAADWYLTLTKRRTSELLPTADSPAHGQYPLRDSRFVFTYLEVQA